MTELLTAIADIAWPVVVLIALVLFLRPLRRVIRTAEEREFTLEVGGQKLSIGQLSKQQSNLVGDLQRELASLQDRLAALENPAEDDSELTDDDEDDDVTVGPPPLNRRAAAGVLWCDDNPGNNALLIQQLESEGTPVELATTTEDALRALDQRDFHLVVSDMAREEHGQEITDAGVRLIREMRQRGITTPAVIYASSYANVRYAAPARAAGADDVTDSPYQLSKHFRRLKLVG